MLNYFTVILHRFFSHSECKHCQIFVISNGQERRPYGWNFAVSDLCHLTKLAIPEEIGLELWGLDTHGSLKLAIPEEKYIELVELWGYFDICHLETLNDETSKEETWHWTALWSICKEGYVPPQNEPICTNLQFKGEFRPQKIWFGESLWYMPLNLMRSKCGEWHH